MKNPYKVLVVDSLHVGDLGAVCPPSVTVGDAGKSGKYTYNEIQRILYDYWKDMCRTKYDLAIVLGEVCDGPNRKQEGLGLWTADTGLQARVGADLLRMIKTDEMFLVYGSSYHTHDNPNTEEYAAELLGLDRHHHGYEKIVEIPGKKRTWNVHIQHSVPTSTAQWTYRTTGIAKELLMAELNRAELGDVDGVIRGHAHYYVEVKFGRQWGFVCPCWKVRDIYAITRGGLGMVPRLGYVTLEFHDEWRSPHIEPHTLNIREAGADMVERVKVGRRVA